MARDWIFKGSRASGLIDFQSSAGAITKRSQSVINFGRDGVRDRFFFFTRNIRTHGPFNHMKRFVIRNFGLNDLVSYGNGVMGFAGVDPNKLRVVPISGL